MAVALLAVGAVLVVTGVARLFDLDAAMIAAGLMAIAAGWDLAR